MGAEEESKHVYHDLMPYQDDPEPTKFVEIVKKWPKVTFCIVMNEFCERFSYYGMRTVLTLYLINILNFNDDNATILFHAFTVLAYSSPLLGSILADGYIGKFWTIFSISLVYAAGQIILAVSSTFKKNSSLHPYMDFVGLFVIAMGTGGIKPCVSAFGADQFKSHYLIMISYYFSVFYFMINAGSTISTFLTPEFRALPCMGQDSCYPLAFGIPAALMIIATVFFMLGSFFYKKVPPKENVIFRVASTIKTALRNKVRSSAPNRDHWLEHFLDTHNCENDPKCIELRSEKKESNACAQTKFVDDVKSLVRVTITQWPKIAKKTKAKKTPNEFSFVFAFFATFATVIMMLPVPMFWALYDQQGSRWIIQAVAMDAQLTNSFALLPDQMATLNAILIMLFIPLFQILIYPFFDVILGIRTTSLRRMVIGGLLAAAAFITSGLVQLAVNETLPDIPPDNTAFLSVINSFPDSSGCNISVSINDEMKTVAFNNSLIDDKVKKQKELYRLHTGDSKDFDVHLNFSGSYCYGHSSIVYNINLKGGKSYYLAVTPQGIAFNETHWDKPSEGEGQTSVSVNFMIPCSNVDKNVTWTCQNSASNTSAYADRLALCSYDGKDKTHPCNPRDLNHYYYWKKITDDWHIEKFSKWQNDNSSDFTFNDAEMTVYEFRDIKKGVYKLYYVHYLEDGDRTPSSDQIIAIPVNNVAFEIVGMGGVLTLTVSLNGSIADLNTVNIHNVHSIVPKNHVSILWQIPQYVIITAGEILFSITGLEFSYSQAAPSMKSVVQAIWLFTVALGDLIIIIIALIPESNLAIEMFAFAVAMIVVVGIFALMSIFYYTYVDYSHEEETTNTTSINSSEFDDITNGKTNYGFNKSYDTNSDLRLRM